MESHADSRAKGAGAPAMATCGLPGLSPPFRRSPLQIPPLCPLFISPSSPSNQRQNKAAGTDPASSLAHPAAQRSRPSSIDMARPGVAVLALLAAAAALAWLPAFSSAGGAADFGGGLEAALIAVPSRKATCTGAVGECGVDEDEELGLGAGGDALLRRSMAQRQPTNRYISYAALKADQVPCNKRGKSYYTNCASQQKANPYRRGCSAITRCQRNTN